MKPDFIVPRSFGSLSIYLIPKDRTDSQRTGSILLGLEIEQQLKTLGLSKSRDIFHP